LKEYLFIQITDGALRKTGGMTENRWTLGGGEFGLFFF